VLQTGRSRVRFPMVSLKFFIDNSSDRTLALGLTQPLIEMRTRDISGGGGEWRPVGRGGQPSHRYVPIVFKSGNLNLLEPQSLCRPVMGLLYPYLTSNNKQSVPITFIQCNYE
jgi:hypothetical protein